MKDALKTIIIALALAAAVVVAPAVLEGETPVDGIAHCVSDDGELPTGHSTCIWQASVDGNGRGESLVRLPDGTTRPYIPGGDLDFIPAQCDSDLGGMPAGASVCAWRYPDDTQLVFSPDGTVLRVS